jgi:hypothetical protein
MVASFFMAMPEKYSELTVGHSLRLVSKTKSEW